MKVCSEVHVVGPDLSLRVENHPVVHLLKVQVATHLADFLPAASHYSL